MTGKYEFGIFIIFIQNIVENTRFFPMVRRIFVFITLLKSTVVFPYQMFLMHVGCVVKEPSL